MAAAPIPLYLPAVAPATTSRHRIVTYSRPVVFAEGMSHAPAIRLTFATTSIPAELQRPVEDREPEIVVTASTTASRLAALNNAFDALKAEQAVRRHLFHVRRETAGCS